MANQQSGPWDDRALVRAYETAVRKYQGSHGLKVDPIIEPKQETATIPQTPPQEQEFTEEPVKTEDSQAYNDYYHQTQQYPYYQAPAGYEGYSSGYPPQSYSQAPQQYPPPPPAHHGPGHHHHHPPPPPPPPGPGQGPPPPPPGPPPHHHGHPHHPGHHPPPPPGPGHSPPHPHRHHPGGGHCRHHHPPPPPPPAVHYHYYLAPPPPGGPFMGGFKNCTCSKDGAKVWFPTTGKAPGDEEAKNTPAEASSSDTGGPPQVSEEGGMPELPDALPQDKEELAALLMAWYKAGYQTASYLSAKAVE